MRTTINIDDKLFSQATEMTGIKEKTKIFTKALEVLIQSEAARRLAELGGTEPDLKPISRRKTAIYNPSDKK